MTPPRNETLELTTRRPQILSENGVSRLGPGLVTDLRLRDVTSDDLPIFFAHQADPVANRMAAFTSKDPADRNAFNTHWAKILNDPKVTMKTIILEGQVVGNVGKFELSGRPNVTYWIGREYWGRGIATIALSMFLTLVKPRPLYASAAKDNVASLRVLEKCGFTFCRYEKAFADARGEEVEEAILELSA